MHFQMRVEAFQGSLSLLSVYLRAVLNKDRCNHMLTCSGAMACSTKRNECLGTSVIEASLGLINTLLHYTVFYQRASSDGQSNITGGFFVCFNTVSSVSGIF